MTAPGPVLAEGARIGPNAILQLVAVLDREGPGAGAGFLRAAGVALPSDSAMAPEADCRAAHLALRRLRPDAPALLRDAGLATGDYILAHRIPAPAQRLIRALPAALGARLLAGAIARHAWSFAGSGRFRIAARRPLTFEIAGNPLCPEAAPAPACVWHAAVFERLFARLVWPGAAVEEIACAAVAGEACRFVIRPAGTAAGNPCRDSKCHV